MQLQLLRENKQKDYFFLQVEIEQVNANAKVSFSIQISQIYIFQLQQGHALLSRFSSNMGKHALLLFNFPGILSRQNRIIYNLIVNEK